jgi:hypothetical protein
VRNQSTLRDQISEHLKTAASKDKITVDALTQGVATLSASIERETNGIEGFREEVRTELKNAEIAARYACSVRCVRLSEWTARAAT